MIVPRFISSAGDLAVSPKLSQTEANGKLFNYMACGLPTVVFDNQINREILGDEGIYVEHGNTSSLADAIISTIHDSGRMSSLSKRVRERAINNTFLECQITAVDGRLPNITVIATGCFSR